MLRIVPGCVLGLLLCAGPSSADDKKGGDTIDAKKLVGKWSPKGEKEGAVVIEFTKDGKVKVTAGGDGKEFKLEGTYKVGGNKVTTTMSFMGKEKTETHTVSKLTDTELVSTDEKGKEETLVRVKGKRHAARNPVGAQDGDWRGLLRPAGCGNEKRIGRNHRTVAHSVRVLRPICWYSTGSTIGRKGLCRISLQLSYSSARFPDTPQVDYRPAE